MSYKCQILIQDAELLAHVAQNWHIFFRSYEEMAENRRKQQKSMSLSSTSETTVEYTIWPVNDTYIITVCWVLKTSRKVDDFYFLIRLLSRAWLWVISTCFEWRNSMNCSFLTMKSVDWIEWYVQFQQGSCTNRLWYNNTTLRKNVIAGYTGFDRTNQHFGYREIETSVLNGCFME